IYSLYPLFLSLFTLRPVCSTLFPYTTLFRSYDMPLLVGGYSVLGKKFLFIILFLFLSHFINFGKRIPCCTAEELEHPHICAGEGDRKSTRLNSSHVKISYAVFCL